MEFELIKSFENIKEEDLNVVVQSIASFLGQKSILLLNGPMGAGKTTFVRNLIESLGGRGVQSPTFALHQRYVFKDFEIEHLDLFRMKSELELDGLGFWDFFQSDRGIVMIEWSERMNLDHLPIEWPIYKLEISLPQPDSRSFKFFTCQRSEQS